MSVTAPPTKTATTAAPTANLKNCINLDTSAPCTCPGTDELPKPKFIARTLQDCDCLPHRNASGMSAQILPYARTVGNWRQPHARVLIEQRQRYRGGGLAEDLWRLVDSIEFDNASRASQLSGITPSGKRVTRGGAGSATRRPSISVARVSTAAIRRRSAGE